MTTRILAVILAVTFCSWARAEVWIGAPSTAGPVQRPAAYTAAVSHLFHQGTDFEKYSAGANLAFQDLGGFYFKSWPSRTARIVRGTSAGAPPSSGMNSLYFTHNGTPTTMYLHVVEPVMSVGFTLMGVESAATLKVIGGTGGEDLLGEYTIPAMSLGGMRRWIGVYEDERVISRVELVTGYAEDYAIDDLQIGVHAPEPGSLALLCLGAVLTMKRRKRGVSIV